LVPIRILVAQSRSDVLAEVIAEAILNAQDLDLVAGVVVSMTEVEPLLVEYGADINVLIAIGDPPETPISALLKRHPEILISHIVIGPELIHFDLKKIGLDQLLTTLRVLARDHAGDRALAYKVVGYKSCQSDRAELIPLCASDDSLMSRALRWVSAVLLLYRRRHPPGNDDVPGFARGQSAVEEALLKTVASTREIEEAQRGLEDAERDLTEALASSDPQSTPLAALSQNLGLTSFEMKVVLLCLAPEIDVKYQGVYGVLNDDLGRRTPTLGLVCALLGDSLEVRAALEQSCGLTRWQLLEHAAVLPHADEALRLEPTIVTWLLGDNQALQNDGRLCHVVRRRPWAGANWIRQSADLGIRQRLAEFLSGAADADEWITLAGEDSSGWRALIEAAALAAGVSLLRVSVAAFAGADVADAAELVVRLGRAAQASQAVPILDVSDAKLEAIELEVAGWLIARLKGITRPGVIIAADVQRLVQALPTNCHLLRRSAPNSAALGAVLSAAATEAGVEVKATDAETLAMTFPLTVDGIDNAIRLATLENARLQFPEQQFELLSSACRRIAIPDLPRFAHRIESTFSLADVVLPQDRLAQLREMVAHVRYASKVLNDWGFGAQLPYGRGIAALFCGASGTGKTMAAQAVARELRRDIYVVDLSQVISKFIGESEKNLDVTFNDAERAGAVLLFDEADALFGKRSEVKDAHDRYANIEVAYLLQRMEAFSGLAILTTNFRQNLDQAFLRRLRFVVEFPRPDAAAREAIWRRCLPEMAPRANDIDLRFLARRLELTGGNIRQITLHAAFAAAGEGSDSIEMRHVVEATRAELFKLGMAAAEREVVEFEDSRRQIQAPVRAA
jgi:AAA+ superfamily predicted ATPase